MFKLNKNIFFIIIIINFMLITSIFSNHDAKKLSKYEKFIKNITAFNFTGNYEKALDLISQAEAEFPDDMVIQYEKGYAVFNTISKDKGMKLIQASLKLNSFNKKYIKFRKGRIYKFLGLYYAGIGNKKEAEKYLQLSLNSLGRKANRELFYTLADIYSSMKKYSKAIEVLERLTDIDPNIIGVYIKKSDLYRNMKQYKKAYFLLFKEYILDNKFDKTIFAQANNIIKRLNKANNMDVFYFSTAFNLQTQRKYDEAANNYKYALEINDSDIIKIYYAQALLASKSVLAKEEAFPIVDELLKKYPNAVDILNLKAVYYYYYKKYNEFVEVCKKILTIAPKSRPATIVDQKLQLMQIYFKEMKKRGDLAPEK